MAITSFLLAATGLFALTQGAPIGSRSLAERSSYAVFAGDGSQSTGWPTREDWLSFDELWQANLGLIKSSCSQFGVPDNDDTEVQNIHDAIVEAAKGGVPEEFILAVMMQESKGCVRAPTTNWGVRNPGLMQDHDGKHTCNEGGVQTPCPKDQIFGMIDDGANGTPQGDGLKQTLAQAGNDDTSKWYRAARIYNSGRVDVSNNLGNGIATHCYASDIANRLVGWTSGASSCKEGDIGALATSEGFERNKPVVNPPKISQPAASTDAPTPTQTPVVTQPNPEPTTTPPAAPTTTPSAEPTATSAPTPTSPAPTNSPAPTVAPPVYTPPTHKPGDANAPNEGDNEEVPDGKGEVYPGAPPSCKDYYTVKKGDYCQKVEQSLNLPEHTLARFNSGLHLNCPNLWLGYRYCIAA